MQKAIIVTTDFSDSAGNEMDYACDLAKGHDTRILLTYIYSFPLSYRGEGFAPAVINDILDSDRKILEKKLEQAKSKYPQVSIEIKMMIGNVLESLRELERELNPEMIIMGTIGEYSELLLWNDEWLDALTGISSPVLVIPKHVPHNQIRNIAFACDYKNACSPLQIEAIKKLMTTLSGASLHIIHVSPGIDEEENKNAALIKKAFGLMKPQYHLVENKQVIKGLDEFVLQNQIDLLIVVPHKHDFWHNLFHRSHTRQLVQLNHIPVMAIHEYN
ncbi:MAG TPA: universal stress protein [Puia sp.]|nr:universal stress protein [Puia sp.]